MSSNDFNGNIVNTFTIVGHNDGLRYNPQGKDLWVVQNEDGNANLSIIDLQTGEQKIFQLGTGPQGGGYDDIDFNNNAVYLSASAPTINPNTAPAIVSAQAQPKGADFDRDLRRRCNRHQCDHRQTRDAESPGSRLDDRGSARGTGHDLTR